MLEIVLENIAKCEKLSVRKKKIIGQLRAEITYVTQYGLQNEMGSLRPSCGRLEYIEVNRSNKHLIGQFLIHKSWHKKVV